MRARTAEPGRFRKGQLTPEYLARLSGRVGPLACTCYSRNGSISAHWTPVKARELARGFELNTYKATDAKATVRIVRFATANEAMRCIDAVK